MMNERNNQLMEREPVTTTLTPALNDTPISQRLEMATVIATELAKVVKSQNLSSNISGRDYVHVDGWVALGNLCGYMPRERSIEEDDTGNVFATVEIIDRAGHIVGAASSMVGMDETMWAKRPRYARRSMAVTRATGKAFRLSLSWVMTLAGYAPTPFEEMPTDEVRHQAAPQVAPQASPDASGKPTQKELGTQWKAMIDGCTSPQELEDVWKAIGTDQKLTPATVKKLAGMKDVRQGIFEGEADPPF